MPTMQSKLVSRTIWLEKKKIWKINIQKNGIRKSFYSSTPGDKGRKICAQNAASWLSGSCPFAVSDHTTVETVFERYLKDKELETTNIYTIRNRYNNHIKPIIGKIPVMLLTKQDLKRVIYLRKNKKCSRCAVPLQFVLDYVYQDLKQNHPQQQHIWDKKQRYKWDRQPITSEQISLIHKLAPDYKIDTKKMTRGDASRVIQLLAYAPKEQDAQEQAQEVQDDAT